MKINSCRLTSPYPSSLTLPLKICTSLSYDITKRSELVTVSLKNRVEKSVYLPCFCFAHQVQGFANFCNPLVTPH